ncbi:threonine ammonia-lyase [Micromonosporaceae bacterium Da 78-11]
MEFSYADVSAARDVVRHHLPPTPMWNYPALDAAAGATVFVKHENTQPVGAFKVRGGLTLLAALSPADRARGTVSYSTGNHAQSLAYASHVHGARCTVVMPAGANPAKAAAVESWGAEVVLTGADLGAAQAYAEQLAGRTGARLVSPGDTPELLAGVGTLYAEILEAQPDLDAIVVPIGSGTGAAAATVVARELAPNCAVIGVQSSASPAAHDSWRAGAPVHRPNRTRVDGLATGRGFDLPQRLMRAGLADFLLVSDDQIAGAQRLLARAAHTLAEGAGAAALAAVTTYPDLFAGRRIAVVCTGANADSRELAALG